jgi:hypothetical protein
LVVWGETGAVCCRAQDLIWAVAQRKTVW